MHPKKNQLKTTTQDVVFADPSSEKPLIDEMKSLGAHWKRAEKLHAEFEHAELSDWLRITREKAAAGELSNPAGYFYAAVTQSFEIPEGLPKHFDEEEERQKYLKGWFDD